MANIFQNLYDNFITGVARKMAEYMSDPLGKEQAILANYAEGNQRNQLAIKQDPKTLKLIDDNIIINHVRLILDRSVSRLFQGGVKFVLPKGRTAQQEYLDSVWDLNKKEIILYQNGLYGGAMGTWYFMINPDDLIDPYTEELYPRLIPINPRTIRIKCAAQDMNDIEEYRIEYSYTDMRDNRPTEVTYRQIISVVEKESQAYDNKDESAEAAETWEIKEYEQVGGGVMQQIGATVAWDYDFPPIIHCKNLPSLEGVYGDGEIIGAINIQDKYNFTMSNTGKIIKFHANPIPVITGVSAEQVKAIDSATGTAMVLPDKDAKATILEMSSDLASSVNFAHDLKEDMFSGAREVDIATIQDKLGSLTNFGLKVLYIDSLNKNDTKRQLYGDALLELNRRLLVLKNWTGEDSRPGTVQWGEAMPINILEEMQADNVALDIGIIDKKSVAERPIYKSRYGVDWETIQANIAKEQQALSANNANIGAQILKNFSQGQGVPSGSSQPQSGKPAQGDAATTNPQPTPQSTDTNPAKTAFSAPRDKNLL